MNAGAQSRLLRELQVRNCLWAWPFGRIPRPCPPPPCLLCGSLPRPVKEDPCREATREGSPCVCACAQGAGAQHRPHGPRLTLLEVFVPAALPSSGRARGPVGRVLWPLQALLGSRSCQLWGPPGRASLRPPGLTLGREHRVRCRVHGHAPERSQRGPFSRSAENVCSFYARCDLPSACPGRKHTERKSCFKRSAFVLSSLPPLRLTAWLSLPQHRHTDTQVSRFRHEWDQRSTSGAS